MEKQTVAAHAIVRYDPGPHDVALAVTVVAGLPIVKPWVLVKVRLSTAAVSGSGAGSYYWL